MAQRQISLFMRTFVKGFQRVTRASGAPAAREPHAVLPHSSRFVSRGIHRRYATGISALSDLRTCPFPQLADGMPLRKCSL
jgi:hypothetical protein